MKCIDINNKKVDIVSDHPNGMILNKLNHHTCEEKEDAFFVCDLGDVVKKYNIWTKQLPRVQPFYAVKCNDDATILSLLAKLGTGFDCASKAELQKVLDLKIDPSRIVYANPCKQSSHIRYAAKTNVQLMTFDNETELQKVKMTFPNAKLVLRILPPENTKCQCELGIKFGAHPKSAAKLLQKAKDLGLDVVGVSFHVGSGCYDATAFSAAVAEARKVFDQGREMGFNFNLLDIGGGFPGQENAKITFSEICQVLRPALDMFFPESMGVKIIAEPGRYFVASAFTLAVNIIAKRKVPRDRPLSDSEDGSCTLDDEPMFMYYVNDGLYGSFNCLLYDHAEVEACLLNPDEYEGLPRYTSSIWGPTCDGLDCITEKMELPELNDGDWLIFKDMGAYTISAATTFNGMAKPGCYYLMHENAWHYLGEIGHDKRPCNNNNGCIKSCAAALIPHEKKGPHITRIESMPLDMKHGIGYDLDIPFIEK